MVQFKHYRSRRRIGVRIRGGLPWLLLVLSLPWTVAAYVMPAEQVLGFVAKNFSGFKAVLMEQAVRVESRDAGEARLYKEKVWARSPGYFRAERESEESGAESTPVDHAYRSLLMSGSASRLQALLSGLGIDLQEVAFDRVERTVAYRIGSRDPEAPKIFIEKKRFLPLLLTYRSQAGEDHPLVRVRFGDYRKVQEGWYPFKIVYSRGDDRRITYTVLDLKTNVSLEVPSPPSSGSETPSVETPPVARPPDREKAVSEKERLRNIIKAFEEKYPQ
ncbi:MAG: hypothetical protein JRH13_13060 [Deltaproteobacteria bacterium]|nr:hypothetical protein [Deltaproteobacteria bacterium]MBW2130283.1 hypothetical protein [Deltaproteobacteria bacterium]